MIDITLILEIATILSIAGGAITFMVRLWNKVENSLLKTTIALDSLVTEVSELKGFEKRISKNETDIAVIKNTCSLNHKEVKHAE